MGTSAKIDDCNVMVPDIQSLLRTVVVPLSELFERFDRLDGFSLRYSRDSCRYDAQESAQAYLDRIADRQKHHVVVKANHQHLMNLNIMKLDEWRDETVRFLIGH
jgi:hypothetical protein